MPAAISTRRSAGRSRRTPARNEPKPAPICAMGPSRPPDPPVPSVMALAMILTIGTRGRNHPLPLVIGFDHRIGPVPFGFGSERVNDPAGEQPAEAAE